ncbi:hypothetical protein HPP92_000677 [Vanilla planifolia]|uniref:DEVIL-like protein n=1 Tax=Vanilla planifolia TaxID=51239 RepID=A0A835VGV0_VANPL|nr:hypothetical protein HPP92_000677 [Vanilla planifolia]
MAGAVAALDGPTSSSHRQAGMRRRCAVMLKQQKTRCYILGRCVSMLLCWHAHNLSD